MTRKTARYFPELRMAAKRNRREKLPDYPGTFAHSFGRKIKTDGVILLSTIAYTDTLTYPPGHKVQKSLCVLL